MKSKEEILQDVDRMFNECGGTGAYPCDRFVAHKMMERYAIEKQIELMNWVRTNLLIDKSDLITLDDTISELQTKLKSL